MDDSTDLPVHRALAEIIGELGGIGKTGYNAEQRYHFRGIDAILGELHPLLARYGVVIVPDVIDRIYEERTSKSGNLGHCTHLHVRYTVYGPAGDSITLSTWGEGLDYSDKATNKAMTAAYKYALLQLFAIADPAEDGDASSPEGGGAKESAPAPAPVARPDVVAFVEALIASGFTKHQQKEIIEAAIGHPVQRVEALTTEEIATADAALASAIADRELGKEYPW
ncbi:MAG: ERF family protein [Dermatophilaceae bacterium]